MGTIRHLVENKTTLDYKEICNAVIKEFGVNEKVNWDSILPHPQQQELFGGEALRKIADNANISTQKEIRPVCLVKGEVSQLLFFYVQLADDKLTKANIEFITKRFIKGLEANRYIIWFFGNEPHTELKVVLSGKEGKKIVLKSLPFGINQPYYKTYDFILTEVQSKTRQLFVEPSELWKALWNAFDISIINRNFYNEIKSTFDALVTQLKRKGNPFKTDEDRVQFAIRLIGRIIFCWFLKRKDVLKEEIISSEAVKTVDKKNYYHDLLEILFFDVLNTPEKERKGGLPKIIAHYPFLNGGLFDAQESDHKDNLQLSIGNDWFHSFFSNTLEKYNFTVDENSSSNAEIAIDPEMLGRIFENLLAEQNPETGESARKATGSYYTPREIVDYMVEQSVAEYLKTALELDEKVDELIEEFVHTQHLPEQLEKHEKQVSDALTKIKVLDPACGSGAFPIGILQKIIALKQQLHPKTKNYKLKLDTIQNSIYGVDIQPMAVELSRLRCWLSLVVDEEANDIKALPNLDFKFVCADSLVDVSATDYVTNDLEKSMKELEENVEQYFSSEFKSKKKIQNAIKANIAAISQFYHKVVGQIITKIRQEEKQANPAKVKKLNEKMMEYFQMDARWNTYENIFRNKKVEFFNPSFFFPSAKKGFDIVIGNPPYGITYSDDEIKSFRSNYSVVVGHSEAYYLFIERAMKLLKPSSVLTFITPNAWLSNKYAKGVRSLVLRDNTLLSLVNLNKKFVFENAGVETCVFLVKKDAPEDSNISLVGNDIVKDKIFPVDSSEWLKNDNLIIGFSDNPFTNQVLDKIKLAGTKLDDLLDLSNGFKPYQVGYGKNLKGKPLTVEDVENKIYHNDKKINPNYKKQIKGKNVNKYRLTWTDGYINWGEWLMSPKEKKYFENPKILIRQIIADTLIATLDLENYYADQTVYIAINYNNKPISLKYCTALLNSKVIGFYFRKFYSEEDALFPKIKVNELKDLPMIKASGEFQNIIDRLVDYLLVLNIEPSNINEYVPNEHIAKQFEELIDACVYELYFEKEVNTKDAAVLKLVEQEFKPIEKLPHLEQLEKIKAGYQILRDSKSEIRNRLVRQKLVEEINIIAGAAQ